MIRLTAETVRQRLLCAVLLLVVCGLCGTFDILSNNFTRWATRMASFPEEEEFHAKDRSSLVAASQPSRRGGLRPRTPPGPHGRSTDRPHSPASGLNVISTAASHLTGAGIFLRC